MPHDAENIVYQTVGMLGSFVIASALVPQIYKMYKTKSARDLSATFQSLYILGVAMMLVYGFGEALWPIYIPASAEILAGVVMLGMKCFYDRRAAKLGAARDDESPEFDLERDHATCGEAAFTAAHTPI